MHLGHTLFRQRERAPCSLLTLSIEARCLTVGNLPSGSYFQRERLEFHCVDHVWRAFSSQQTGVPTCRSCLERKQLDIFVQKVNIHRVQFEISLVLSLSHLPVNKRNVQEYRWGINNCSVDGNSADRYPNSRSRWHLSRLISSLWSHGKKGRHWQI